MSATPKLRPFIDAVLSEDARIDEIDAFIEQWSENSRDRSVEQALGLTPGEYAAWRACPELIHVIVAARRAHTPLEAELQKLRSIANEADRDARWALSKSRAEAGLAALGAGPWLLHGTTRSAADLILQNGFEPNRSTVAIYHDDQPFPSFERGVFWTDKVEIAVISAFSKTPNLEGSGAVVLAARKDAVLSSGTPMPDNNMWEIETNRDPTLRPKTWEESLKNFASITILSCTKVDGLAAIDVTPASDADLDLLPFHSDI